MMVSNGNVTGLVERLWNRPSRSPHLRDRPPRAGHRLTKSGRAEFRKMAAEHQTWISDMFGDLSPKDVRELMRLLAKTKGSVQKSARRRQARSGDRDRLRGRIQQPRPRAGASRRDGGLGQGRRRLSRTISAADAALRRG
jgi:hypothetical protein